MSNGHRWSKFWWPDWQNDPGLKLCGHFAKGVWIDLLCIMAMGERPGYLVLNGRAPTTQECADLLHIRAQTVHKVLAKLEKHGVFSRTDDGIIYNRRMVRDAAASEAGRAYISRRWSGNGQHQPTPPPNSPPNREPNRAPTSPPKSPPITPYSEAEAEERSSLRSETAHGSVTVSEDVEDVRSEVWNEGVQIVRTVVGLPLNRARRLVGKLLRDADDDCARVLWALRQATETRSDDPVAWLIAACNGRNGKSVHQQIREAIGGKSFFDDDQPQPAPTPILRVIGGTQ